MSTISKSVGPIAALLISNMAVNAAHGQVAIQSDRTQKLMATAKQMVAVDADGCLKSNNADEIVVCGAFDANRRYRLPLPELAVDEGKPLPRGEIPNGNPEIIQQGRCYITVNERNCFKGVPIFSLSIGGSRSKRAEVLWREIPTYDLDATDVERVQVKAVEDSDDENTGS